MKKLTAEKGTKRMEIASRPEAVTADWMTETLSASGVLQDGQAVADTTFKKIGNGMMSDTFRFDIVYEGDYPEVPETLVGKFSAQDPTSKATARSLGIYRTEVGFYRELAPSVAAHVPQALFAQIDPATDDFTILMRNLSPARTVDQIDSCSIDDAELAVRELAQLHGSRWGDGRLSQIPSLKVRAEAQEAIVASLPSLIDGFADRYVDLLEPAYMAAVRRYVPIYSDIVRDKSAPKTIQHGDYRLDNLLFDAFGERGVHIVDWGTVNYACGLPDLSYFIGGSLSDSQRTRHEAELVRAYFDELKDFSIGNYDWDQCWCDYRRFAFLGIFCGVGAPMMVERTERGDRVFLAMVRNYVEQINRLDSASFWS